MEDEPGFQVHRRGALFGVPAELYFTERRWPEFGAADFDEALAWFAGRERRFGRLPAAAAAHAARGAR